MKCEDVTQQFLARLAGESDPASDAAVAAHLEACAECRLTTAGLAESWAELGAIPAAEPSPLLRARFDAMLSAYRQGAREARRSPAAWQRLRDWTAAWSTWRPAPALGMALLLLLLGIGVGSRWDLVSGRGAEIRMLRQEVQSTRALVALSLLRQSSPTDRLQGVTWGASAGTIDPAVLAALLTTLDDDTSVNVRLAVVDALSSSAKAPQVRAGLMASLPRQTSPLVQIALIDALAPYRDAAVADLLRHLAGQDKLDATVRERARWALQQQVS
jgi:predicted anti-sigma-YlaC factor YlaD